MSANSRRSHKIRYRSLGNAGTLFNESKRATVRNRLWSFYPHVKKDLSSGESETLNRSRSPITVVRANGDVQTNEEAQVYVHDLHLFVTVQLLEDTPAVLSLGTLCKGHGYTYERPSGREPRLTQTGSNPSAKLRTSFHWLFQDYHRVPPQLHPRHRLRRIDLFLWTKQIREVTRKLRKKQRSCGKLQHKYS